MEHARVNTTTHVIRVVFYASTTTFQLEILITFTIFCVLTSNTRIVTTEK